MCTLHEKWFNIQKNEDSQIAWTDPLLDYALIGQIEDLRCCSFDWLIQMYNIFFLESDT